MSLRSFVIVVGVLVLLFVFGLAGQACGGISSGTGFVSDIDSIIGVPELTTDDIELVQGEPSCISGTALVIPAGRSCTYELTTFLDRRLVVTPTPALAGFTVVVSQEDLVTVRATFPEDELRAHIERKRSMVVNTELSLFTVGCVPTIGVTNPCRLELGD